MGSEAWLTLFRAAFRGSRNAMCLAVDPRCIVDVNGACLQLLADGTTLRVQWGATTQRVTGRRLVLVVALSISGRGRGLRLAGPAEASGAALTDRQRQIVQLVALGRTGLEIADELHISLNTVRTHMRNSMKTVGGRSRAQRVAKALAEGHALAQ